MAEGQWRVQVGKVAERLGHELMPRDLAHDPQHPRIDGLDTRLVAHRLSVELNPTHELVAKRCGRLVSIFGRRRGLGPANDECQKQGSKAASHVEIVPHVTSGHLHDQRMSPPRLTFQDRYAKSRATATND